MTKDKHPTSDDGLLDTHVQSFLKHLPVAGYAKSSLRKRRPIAVSFARWTQRHHVALKDLNESHVAAFLEGEPQRSHEQFKLERATLRCLLRHLRAEAIVPAPAVSTDTSPIDELERRYIDYLRRMRGLSERTVCVYAPVIHAFLRYRRTAQASSAPAVVDAPTVRDFLLDRVRDRASESSRLLAAALRSFLRFLALDAETPGDLSGCVPTFRKGRQAGVPSFLSHEEVEQILATTDTTTSTGRRDRAILLLLARLGLRAGEVVTLELDDIHWRAGEIQIRGKGRGLDRLPLLSDVGHALADYIRLDRGQSTSRCVFLRRIGPHVGLTGPASVGHVVRKAFRRAGVRPSSRGAAHLMRHSLATRMIRHGASIAEIAQVLRHRSHDTTAIYAKVSLDALREVARPWPGAGGAQ
jgi:integrase/recombinase XerD